MSHNLIFHCFPKLDADWRAACLSTFRFRQVFDGRVVISIVYGAGCERVDRVMDWFEPFGPGLEFKLTPNVAAMGINTTFRDQLQSIRREPGIVFKGHTKGISHPGDIWAPWRDNMAFGCLSDMTLVDRKFAEGFRSFGVYKTASPDGAGVMAQNWDVTKATKRVKRQAAGIVTPPWRGWHYPGAMFWFDPKFIPDTFFTQPMHHYENEAFPCYLGPTETGFSVKPDNLLFASANISPFFKELQKPLCESEMIAAAAAGHL